MTTFKKVKLGDVITKIIGGGTPSKNNSDYWNGALPWASVKDLNDKKYYLDSTQDFITEEGLKSSASNLIKKDTIILPTRMGLGRVVKTRINTTINQDLKAIIPNEKIDNNFLLWSLVNSGKKLQILGNGSTVSGIRLEELKNIKIDLPDLSTQTRIASVLSAYDDLIENNEKRIKALEEMAQLLYTEWFVKFKFPPCLAKTSAKESGYKKAKTKSRSEQSSGTGMVDSNTEFGMIPEGWEVKKFYDVVNNFDSQRKPISSMKRQSMQGTYPYYGAAKIIDYVNNFIFDGRYLLIAEDGSVITLDGKPVLQFVDEKFWVSNHAHIVQGKLLSTEILYLRLRRFDIKPLITGSAQPKITKNNLSRILFIVPDKNTEIMFTNIVKQYFNEIFNLKEQNKNLSKTRDLLIPQLVTGKRELK